MKFTPRLIVRRRGSMHPALPFVGGSLVLAAVLIGVLVWKPAGQREKLLTVYCAAAIEPTVKAVGKQYETDYGVHIEIRAGNSGSLVAQIALAEQGDLYIPADDSFIVDAKKQGLVAEHVPLAEMRLVLGVKRGNPRGIKSLDDLLKDNVAYGFANPKAAVGRLTRDVLTQAGRWDEIHDHAKVQMPTVTDLAAAMSTGTTDAVFVWDTVAKQYDLEEVRLPELSRGIGHVAVGVLSATQQPAAALRFARYLAAPDKGQLEFVTAGFTSVAGDAWEEKPTITFYSGGIQRLAIKDTLQEFERREGCQINVVFEGCGTLLGMMRGENPKLPDAYFACDVSFLTPDDIQPLFLPPREMTETEIVILVHKGNPRKIEKLEDLALPDLKLGVAHEALSALGALTKKLLQSKGIYEQVRANVRVAGAPKADILVGQILAGGEDTLDAVIVYEANTSQVHDQLDVVPIHEPGAMAVQPLAIGRDTKHRQLMGRLEDTLRSATSKSRFESVGFRWRSGEGSK